MSKCSDITNVPGIMDGWGCCACHTYNGNQRSECKACAHPRCHFPDVIRVPIQEAKGIRMIPVTTKADPKNLN